MNGDVERGRWVVFSVVLIIVITVGLGSVFLIGVNPTVTGFVSATTYTEYVNTEINKNTGYFFAAGDMDSPKEIRSLSISGKIIGSGVVNIYLEDENSNKYLIFSNERQESFNRITGLVISNGFNDRKFNIKPISQAGDLIDFNQIPKDEPFSFVEVSASDISFVDYVSPEQETVEYYEPNGDGVTGFSQIEVERPTGLFDSWFSSTPYEGSPFETQRPEYTEFRNKCIETCVLFEGNQKVYRFIFEVEPGTKVMLDSITYAVNEETLPLM